MSEFINPDNNCQPKVFQYNCNSNINRPTHASMKVHGVWRTSFNRHCLRSVVFNIRISIQNI